MFRLEASESSSLNCKRIVKEADRQKGKPNKEGMKQLKGKAGYDEKLGRHSAEKRGKCYKQVEILSLAIRVGKPNSDS
jgi:hypothetical protein